ncbi:hypothetical protein Q9966_010108 [Columba livia]|nr:hypothetical protein Q9966_010108 [Columba livia]
MEGTQPLAGIWQFRDKARRGIIHGLATNNLFMEQHVRGKWEHLHICVSAELAQGPTAELAAAFSPRASCSQTDNESYVRTDDEESCFRTDDEENSAANFTEEWNQEVQRLLTKKSHN